MRGPFDRLPSAEPDEIELELLRLGAITDPEQRTTIEAAAAGPLGPVERELQAFESYWAAHRPPLPLPTSVPTTPWWRRRSVAAAAMAALVVLALATSLRGPPTEGVRAMGALPVDVVHLRDGEPVGDGEGLHRAGDHLRLALSVPADGYIDVVAVEANGKVAPLVVGRPVRAGERFSLAGAIRLDDTEQREWLVVELVEEKRDAATVKDDMRGLLPEPSSKSARRRWVQEVTRRP